MDVERTIEFLLQNAARADARMTHAEKRLEKAEKLTIKLIGLMSQQTDHHVRMQKEMDRRFKETWDAIERLGKRIDTFVASMTRTNGHKKNGHA